MSDRTSRGAPITVDFQGGKLTGRAIGTDERGRFKREATYRTLIGEGKNQMVHEAFDPTVFSKRMFFAQVQGFTGLMREDGSAREFSVEELEEIWSFEQELAARMMIAIENAVKERAAGRPTAEQEAEGARKNSGSSQPAPED